MLVILISQMIVDLQQAEKLRGQNFALFAPGFPASTAPLHLLHCAALVYWHCIHQCTALYPLVHCITMYTLYPPVHWHCIHQCTVLYPLVHYITMYIIVSTSALALYPLVHCITMYIIVSTSALYPLYPIALQALHHCTSLLNSESLLHPTLHPM